MLDNVCKCLERHLGVFELLGGGLRGIAVHGLQRVEVLRLSVEEVQKVDGEFFGLLKEFHIYTLVKHGFQKPFSPLAGTLAAGCRS